MTTMPMPDESGVLTKTTPRSVSETVARLTSLLHSKGMKVFVVIDQSAEARQVGLNLRDTVMVVFGNPTAGTPVMDAVPLAALDLPLKVLLWDDAGQQHGGLQRDRGCGDELEQYKHRRDRTGRRDDRQRGSYGWRSGQQRRELHGDYTQR